MSTKKSPQSVLILPSLPETRERILVLCDSRGRPVTIGETAMHLGWWATLAKVEGVLEEMVEDGILKKFVSKWDEDVPRYGRLLGLACLAEAPSILG